VRAAVVRRTEADAVALAGGRLYVFGNFQASGGRGDGDAHGAAILLSARDRSGGGRRARQWTRRAPAPRTWRKIGMPVRRIAVEPASRLAIWARRFAGFSLPVVALAIIIERAGVLEIVPGLATFAAALAMAFIAVLLALASLIGIWRRGIEGLGAAVTALAIGLALLAYPSYLAVKATRLPMIADITTDPIDPPRFETIGRLRTRLANPVAYAGLYAAELQRQAYPDIVPLDTDASVQSTYDATMAVITKRRWQVINTHPPVPGRREAYIEAVARTPIMGFRDDIAIRIRQTGKGTRVDVRSASRYGRHDFGTNAARVRALLADVDDLAENKEEKPEGPARPVQKQPAAKPAQTNQPARAR
jgi:uncharacterized protein (DUF1499 family)